MAEQFQPVMVNLHAYYAQLLTQLMIAAATDDDDKGEVLYAKVKAFKLLFPETAAYFEKEPKL